ncbi:hypothetical protein P7K49_014990 [Saguinus oedipus]|uniref:NADP-dependent oxidoreductase domain-containing protein n=1 Tax=Saguinus oedipus TaxID=9490 RepID=A0ABQ9V7Z2_SAGOE|nr:hypothetical protein P7K49_014990 [Saguinus oedipus]
MDIQPQTCSISASPLRVKKDNPVLLEDPVLNAIAEKHRRTPAQVALRYQLQRGVVVLAKSFTEKRIKENFQVSDFQLTPEDMKTIDGLNKNMIHFENALPNNGISKSSFSSDEELLLDKITRWNIVNVMLCFAQPAFRKDRFLPTIDSRTGWVTEGFLASCGYRENRGLGSLGEVDVTMGEARMQYFPEKEVGDNTIKTVLDDHAW